jgi:rod shape-determining protein MreC
VGKVTQLKRNGNGLFQDAVVIPSVDVTRVEEVLVITRSELPVEEPESAALAPGKAP